MKFLTALILCFSLNAFADHHEDMEKKWDAMSFEDAKKMKLEKIDMKMKMMEETRKCVNDAKDKDGLRSCWKEMKEEKKEMKDKMKDKMKGKKKK